MSSFNVTLKPALVELALKPGETITQAFEITNNSDSTLVMTTSVLPWIPNGSDGSVTYDNAVPNSDIQFSLGNADIALGQSISIKPKESQQIVLKITSDSSQPVSDSYYTFFVDQDLSNSLTNDSNSTSASARVGSHLLLSSSSAKNFTSNLSISKFTTSPQFKDSLFSKINISALITNNSGSYNKTQGKLTISKNNLTIKEFTLFPNNVLARNSRWISCLSEETSVPCTLNPPLWPGVYSATITLDPSISDSTASTTFFVFPYSALIGVLALFLLFRRLFRRQTRQITT